MMLLHAKYIYVCPIKCCKVIKSLLLDFIMSVLCHYAVVCGKAATLHESAPSPLVEKL